MNSSDKKNFNNHNLLNSSNSSSSNNNNFKTSNSIVPHQLHSIISTIPTTNNNNSNNINNNNNNNKNNSVPDIIFENDNYNNESTLNNSLKNQQIYSSNIHYLLQQFNNVTNTLNNSNSNLNKINKQQKYDLVFNNQNQHYNSSSNNNSLQHHNSILLNEEDQNKISKEAKKNVNYLVSGSIAGAISRSATAGFERLTIIQQVQGMSQNLSKNYVGCIGALREMVKREGFKSLFKGNFANIVKVSPNSGIRFLTYEFCKKNFIKSDNEKMTVPQTMFSGAMAGLTSTFFTYPLDVVRIRLSLQGSSQGDYAVQRYNGITHGFLKISKEEGIKGLYKGLGTSILSIVPWVSISFATYEGFKIISKKTLLPILYNDINNSNILNHEYQLQQQQQHNNNNIQEQRLIEDAKKGVNMICDFICGALSGAVTMTVCYPLDVLRRRMMIQGIGGAQVLYENGLDATKKILKTEGIKAFYHGIIPAYFKVVPTVAISFAVYELCKELFGENIPSSSSTTTTTTNQIKSKS